MSDKSLLFHLLYEINDDILLCGLEKQILSIYDKIVCLIELIVKLMLALHFTVYCI